MKKKDIRDSEGEPLNQGDLVKLKSGGAEMIIRDIYLHGEKGQWMCECTWQDELNMPQQQDYPPTGLIKISAS